jgi:uncharacterized membrane protein
VPVFISYLFSFIFIAIYWGNHHHLLHTAHHVSGKLIWANMSLLFFLSLLPFTTGWMGENHFTKLPVATYSVNLLLCAVAFYILQNVIMSGQTQNSKLTDALKKQEKKGIVSLLIYITSAVCAFFYPIISEVLIAITAIMWVVPDKHIEHALKETNAANSPHV